MDENKQIEEIAKDLCPLYEKYKSCKTCDAVLGVGEEPCVYKCMAELITTKGYRKQEWISVEERLPEEKVMVLGFYHSVFKGGGHYDLVLVMELQNGLFVPFNCSPVKNGLVTHWMPLPSAPKGE